MMILTIQKNILNRWHPKQHEAMSTVQNIVDAINRMVHYIGPAEVHDFLEAIRGCTKLHSPLYKAILDAEFEAAELQDEENEE